MLASVAPGPFDGDDWLFELKWDGYRCLAYLATGQVYLDSRNAKPLLPQFPVLSSMAAALRAKDALLDGEIVAMKGGRVDFSYLRTSPSSVLYACFDLLWLDGEPMLEVPLDQRKRELKKCMAWGESAIYSETVEGQGKTLFSFAKSQDLEGVMGKRRDSLYFPGERTTDWLKVKNLHQGVFWVVGYMPSPGRIMGSAVVAVKEGDGYRIVGRVSSGLNGEYEKLLLGKVRPLDVSRPPAGLTGLPPRPELRQVRWVEPFYGLEIDYIEVTPDGHLRHPVLKEVVTPDAR